MKALVVGGSGHVGSLTLLYLKDLHNLRVLDLKSLLWGLSVNALGLCRAVTQEQSDQYSRVDRDSVLTSAPDVASAFDAALRFRPVGFETFFIAGAYNQHLVCLKKASVLLGWEPLARSRKSNDDYSFA